MKEATNIIFYFLNSNVRNKKYPFIQMDKGLPSAFFLKQI